MLSMVVRVRSAFYRNMDLEYGIKMPWIRELKKPYPHQDMLKALI